MRHAATRQRTLAHTALAYACAFASLIFLTGCGGPPRVHTTFLDSVDLIEMTDRMAESFVQAPAVRERSSESETWVISMNRMINHTNEVIPDREKWLYVARLRALLGTSEVGRERNLIWIIPVKHWHIVEAELGPAPPELRMTPTHELTAEFTALTATSARGRSDTYLCEYTLIDLSNGKLIWNAGWEVKRAVTGLTYD